MTSYVSQTCFGSFFRLFKMKEKLRQLLQSIIFSGTVLCSRFTRNHKKVFCKWYRNDCSTEVQGQIFRFQLMSECFYRHSMAERITGHKLKSKKYVPKILQSHHFCTIYKKRSVISCKTAAQEVLLNKLSIRETTNVKNCWRISRMSLLLSVPLF